MVNVAMQVCGYVLSLVGWLMGIATCVHPNWRRNDLQGEVMENVIRTTGLWVRCTHRTTGRWTCDDYDSFFMDLPGTLQAARAFTCTSIACGFVAFILATFGIQCTTVLSNNGSAKVRMAQLGSLFSVISGLCLGIGVSWFATEVLQDYQNPSSNAVSGLRYIYGEALFIGWVAMVIMITGGLLLGCGSKTKAIQTSYAHNFPKRNRDAAEYI